MTWAGRGGGADYTGSPADLSAFSSTLAPSFSWKRSRVAQQLAFCTLALPPSAARNVGGDAGMVKVGFYHTLVFPPLFFLQRGLAGGARHKEADNRGHSQQHGDHDPNLGGGGGRATPPAITAAHKIRANTKKAGDRQMRWNEFMLQSTSLGSVFLPLRQTRRKDV